MRRHLKPPISYMATVLGGHGHTAQLENSRSRPGRLCATRQSFQRRICRVSGSWEETKLAMAMNCQRDGVRTASGSGQQASLPQAGSLLARHHACREPWIAVRAQPSVRSVNKTPTLDRLCRLALLSPLPRRRWARRDNRGFWSLGLCARARREPESRRGGHRHLWTTICCGLTSNRRHGRCRHHDAVSTIPSPLPLRSSCTVETVYHPA